VLRLNGDFKGAVSDVRGGGEVGKTWEYRKMTKGMREALEDHFILKKRQKKSHPIGCRCSRPVIHWLDGWRSREKRRLDGFFQGKFVVFCCVDPFGWLDRGEGDAHARLMHVHMILW